ncbi:MAG: acetyl-CoA carboxylase biotin carboxylase subunit [Saprospiraceae bacterium]
MIKPIKKILIANRGEIAARIMRTCKRLHIKTVAVYSEADRMSPHVLMADESVFIGPSPSRDSYLNAEKIISAALNTHADAIHPGYGFLSENDVFARAVENAGIIFIGPSPESIHTMGNKLSAKEAAKEFRIPLVPGSESALSDLNEAMEVGKRIGYPLLVKAAAGGGGKGMRIVQSETELESQIERAMSEALSSFGDGSVFIEKYVSSPRHIEVQILADQYGHCIHLFERECSIQRRHQKIIEEAPSSILSSEKREIMGQDAIRVAQSCQYRGAGTVEFLLDDKGNHYFLEMNTRLQVEHPVTEFITGLDLVEWQIRIAEGHPLTLQQKDLTIDGHGLELRVYAENPLLGFSPSTGKLIRYRHPTGNGIRVDEGYSEGLEIPIHYDPMISKLIVHAPSRVEAIEKLSRAIDEYQIHGVDTTLAFGKFAINHPDFISGHFDTNFVAQHMDEFISSQRESNFLLARFVEWLDEKRSSKLVLPEMGE